MDEREFQRGVRDAQADIAAGAGRLFFQTRGAWGELFTELMRKRFCIQVVHVSDMTWEAKVSYEDGYNGTIKAHLKATFGAGAFDRTWKEVDDFHAAALAHGGKSDGPPGLRLHYNPDFYAAYVRDPDGNKICALCRGFTSKQ